MSAYYNEIEPYAAQWLRNLIKAGLIADGEVDERSIADVQADDLRGFTQCHFFAGIGGWSYALRLAGWPDSRPVWTGSCPCQPFSIAGKGKGQSDERHLWPEFLRLIAECRPATVFGEQVAGSRADSWLDGVAADMEGVGYAFGAGVLPAYIGGLPMEGARWFWVSSLPSHGFRDAGQSPREATRRDGQKWPRSAEDLRAVFDSPTEPGKRHPQPIIRLDHDGLSPAVVKLRTKASGNAIVPQVAAEFISAFMDSA